LDNNPIIFNDLDGDKIKYRGSRQFKKDMKAHLKTIKKSVDVKTRKSIEALEKDKERVLYINEVNSNSGLLGFQVSNNKKVANVGIADKETLESVVVPGQEKVTYDNGVETHVLIQNNQLFTVANEISHAIDWYMNTETYSENWYDEFTNTYDTGLNWDEV